VQQVVRGSCAEQHQAGTSSASACLLLCSALLPLVHTVFRRTLLHFVQTHCVDVLEIANSSVKKLRELTDPKHFCVKGTQSKMLALLKSTFIGPLNGGPSLRDHILSMDDGFEFLLRNRSAASSLAGVSAVYNLCTGRQFSPNFQVDPDFLDKLSQVHCKFS
jgi:hypothetical protein